MKTVKGYKAFNKDLTCRDMRYEIGKTYEMEGKPIPCERGYHFCKSLVDCYNYYSMSEDTRICEVKAIGDVATDDDVKFCTNKIAIVKEVKNPREKSNLSESSIGYCNSGNRNSGNWNSGDCNSGNWNSGNRNSGDCNSGNRNSGDCNSGNWNSGNSNSGDWNSGNCNSGNRNSGNRNSGNCNSGNWNSGDCNSGNRNSGNRNSGNWNSGNRNSGDCNSGNRNSGDCNSGNWNSGNSNSGDWNSGNWNSGVFCTSKNPTIKLFDKESDWTMDDWIKSYARDIMLCCPYTHSSFVYALYMTDEEKEKHPEHKTIGGYIKTFVVTTEDKQKWWDELLEEEKKAIIMLPNFDADKFRECTGIEVKND